MLSEAFISVLRSGRDMFNAQFAHARTEHPLLAGEAFSAFLVECVDPVVRAVAAVQPQCVGEVVAQAYEVGLEIIARQLAGSGSMQTAVAEGWQRVLPAAASVIASEPRRVLASVTNALHQLANSGAQPDRWISEMVRLAPMTADAESFLKTGQIVAWRAGLAHFRSSALAVADTLPEPLARAAVGAMDGTWAETRERLYADLWFVPGKDAGGEMRVVARAGSFRGFGGLFTEPPLIACGEDCEFFVRSGSGCWLLMVDAFGATFHRAGVDEFEKARRHPSRTANALQLRGTTMTWNGERLELPVRGEITSTAANGNTFAVTSSLTHAVTFVAPSARK